MALIDPIRKGRRTWDRRGKLGYQMQDLFF